METAGAVWLDWLLPPHAARKQIAASKKNVEIRRLATTANLHLKNVSVINGIARTKRVSDDAFGPGSGGKATSQFLASK
jgi:hypothetical protein